MQPGVGWDDKSPKGFRYKSKIGLSAGVTKVQFKTGDAGKTKVQLQAKGANLVLPELSITYSPMP